MRLSRWIWLLSAAILAFNVVLVIVHPEGKYFVLAASDILPVVCSVLAIVGTAAAFRRFKTHDEAKPAWLLLLIGVIAFSAAEVLYGFQELILGVDMNENYPNVADIFWVFGYLPFLAGLALFLRSYVKSGFTFGNWKPALLPAAAAFVAAIVLMVAYVFLPISADAGASGIEKFVYNFYPAADMVLLAPALLLVYITSRFGRGGLAFPWFCVALGLILFTLSDIAFSIASWQGNYEYGGVTDLGWNAAYLAIALGGIFQREVMVLFGKEARR